jgi:hypothetical protein
MLHIILDGVTSSIAIRPGVVAMYKVYAPSTPAGVRPGTFGLFPVPLPISLRTSVFDFESERAEKSKRGANYI